MQTYTRLCFTLMASLLLFISPCLAAENDDKSAWPNHIRILTGPNGGQWFTMGDNIAEVISKEVMPATSRMGGGLANISDINEGLGDIAFSLACFMGAAQSNEEEYKSIPLDNTTILMGVYPQVLYFLVRKEFAEEHNINNVKDLLALKTPVRFASLKPGTASEFILNMLLTYGYHTSFDKLRSQGWEISFNNYAETADNFVSAKLDCFAYTAGTEVPLILTMEEYTEVLILPIDQDVLDLLEKKFNTSTYTIPTNIYKSVTEPVKTLGDQTILIVRKDLPDNLVYALNKALWENKGQIAASVKDFGGLNPATALPEGLPQHSGSIKFWTELDVQK